MYATVQSPLKIMGIPLLISVEFGISYVNHLSGSHQTPMFTNIVTWGTNGPKKYGILIQNHQITSK